jgi:hypothetical protein
MDMTGRCSCGTVRYRIHAAPMIVHCCHCSWCQRETGSAFVVNALVEMSEVELLAEAPVIVDTPSHSGRGQKIARCAQCHIALWSHYSTAGELAAFVRVGTLDDKSMLAPDVHIFTGSRQPWVVLADGKPSFEDYYPSPEGVWSDDARVRWRALLAQVK